MDIGVLVACCNKGEGNRIWQRGTLNISEDNGNWKVIDLKGRGKDEKGVQLGRVQKR